LSISIAALLISCFVWFTKPKSRVVAGVTFPEKERLVAPLDGSMVIKSFDLPESITFAGELVPLDDPDIRERLDREIHVNVFFHSSTIFLIKRSTRFLPEISKILEEQGVPADMVYLAVIESGLQNVVSPSEAVGFWQILKGTAKEYGLEVDKEVDERYDPFKATVAASKYLKKAHQTFGSWTNAAASYNVGMRGLARNLEGQNVENYYDLRINEETSRYIFRAIAIKLIMSNPDYYGYQIADEHKYQPEVTKDVVVTSTIDDLTLWAIDQGINYKILIRNNPWLRAKKLTVKSGESFTIKIPKT
jgi:hypothetical protein